MLVEFLINKDRKRTSNTNYFILTSYFSEIIWNEKSEKWMNQF